MTHYLDCYFNTMLQTYYLTVIIALFSSLINSQFFLKWRGEWRFAPRYPTCGLLQCHNCISISDLKSGRMVQWARASDRKWSAHDPEVLSLNLVIYNAGRITWSVSLVVFEQKHVPPSFWEIMQVWATLQVYFIYLLYKEKNVQGWNEILAPFAPSCHSNSPTGSATVLYAVINVTASRITQ